MRKTLIQIIPILAVLLFSASTTAQKGMGDSTGIARQAVKPSVTTLSGKLLEIETGPCEKTTGRALIGAHLIIHSEDGQTLNLHLGPASAVDHVIDQLAVGQSMRVDAFRTEQLPENAYIVKSVILNDKVIHLRDDNLRPSWAYDRGSSRGGRQGLGPRHGRWGPCW